MKIEVGPVSSASALMWLAYARTVLARIMVDPGAFSSVALDMSGVERLEAYVNLWEEIARNQDEFHWTTDEDPDDVRRLADTWIAISDVLVAEEAKRGYPLAHPDSFEFNDALAHGVLVALAEWGADGGHA